MDGVGSAENGTRVLSLEHIQKLRHMVSASVRRMSLDLFSESKTNNRGQVCTATSPYLD